MRSLISALGAILVFFCAQTAQAAAVINSSNVGTSFSVDFTGQIGGSPAAQLSALLNVTFTGLSPDGRTFTFAYSLTNDSTVASRIRSFGFDVNGGVLASASSTGAFPKDRFNDNFPDNIGIRDVCFHAAGNGAADCTGGPNGVTKGQTGTGTFTLVFSGAQPPPSSLYLDLFVVRYQSIAPGDKSGVGIGTVVPPPVPEPSTWLMMILGFFALGLILRQRKTGESGRLAIH